jgi:DNA-directed RNA polymerase specialized sigma24 family protein
MCLHRRDSDQTFSQTEIAEVCGVDRRTINWLERSAKHKLRKALYRAGVRSRFDHR